MIFYRLISTFFYYLAPLFLKYRLSKGKEDILRYREKLGVYPKKRLLSDRFYVHIHGASVGETLSALPIIQELQKKYQDIFIIVTSCTKTSADLMAKKLPDNCMHLYAPIDTPQAVKKFYNHYKPIMSLILDSEIWPNKAYYAKKYNIPIYGINTRLSKKSMQLWRKIPLFFTQILSAYHGLFVQNKVNADFFGLHFTGLIKIIPNLKWAISDIDLHVNQLKLLQLDLKNRFVICLQSTHDNEEDEITRALIDKNFFDNPKNLLIIVPRHPKRTHIILETLKAYKNNKHLLIACRSNVQNIPSDVNLYIADTIGETALWSALSDFIFIGNSLNCTKKGGGHNPIEVAYFGKAIFTGPKRHNFLEIYDILNKNDACIYVDNAREFVEKMIILQNNHLLWHKLIANSKQTYKINHQNALGFLDTIYNKISEIQKNAST